LVDPTLSQACVQMTKAIIDIAGPLGISVPDCIIVRKNGMPASRLAASQHRGAPPQQALFTPVVPHCSGFTKSATL